jgi:hypothetical protein
MFEYNGYLIKENERGFFYVMVNSNYALCSVKTMELAKNYIDSLVKGAK